MSAAEPARPRVSVLTAVHNAEPFLERTLRTLFAQSFRDFEAVVIDDGSTDGSANVVEALARNEPRIRLFRQQNEGVAGALNRGIREARGELIALLDHDDLWHPAKLERQVGALDRDPSLGFVGCYSALVDIHGRCLGWRFGTPAAGDVYREMLYCDLVAGGSVALLRRSVFDEAGFFDPAPEISGRSDWDLWLRIARHRHYTTVEETLVGYTRSPENYSRDYPRMLNAGAAVLAKAAAADPALDAATLERALARDAFGIFCLCVADGEVAAARACLRRSFAFSPRPVLLSPKRWAALLGFGLASMLPRHVFDWVWRVTARVGFGITPGQPFAEVAGPGKLPRERG